MIIRHILCLIKNASNVCDWLYEIVHFKAATVLLICQSSASLIISSTSIIFHAKIQTLACFIFWNVRIRCLSWCDNKLNIFDFYSTNKEIWRCHFGLWDVVMNVVNFWFYFIYFHLTNEIKALEYLDSQWAHGQCCSGCFSLSSHLQSLRWWEWKLEKHFVTSQILQVNLTSTCSNHLSTCCYCLQTNTMLTPSGTYGAEVMTIV